MVKRSCESDSCGTFVLGFVFDEVNQRRSSGRDPLISDPLHFRVESKSLNLNEIKISDEILYHYRIVFHKRDTIAGPN